MLNEMPKHAFLFRLRRWFGLTRSEIFWMRIVLPSNTDPWNDLFRAVVENVITVSTARECVNFHMATGLPEKLDVGALISFLEN